VPPHLVPRCADQISLQAAAFIRISRCLRQQNQEDFLRDFFCCLLLSGHVQRKPEHRSLVPPVKNQKRLFIAFTGKPQKLRVAQFVLGRLSLHSVRAASYGITAQRFEVPVFSNLRAFRSAK
jgi:hypothetical protein